MDRSLVSIGISLLVLGGVFGFLFNDSSFRSVGSVVPTGTYKATTTRSTSASATAGWLACTGRSTLGSIVVSKPATAGYLQVWDATSTATSTYVSTNTSDPVPTTTVGHRLAKVDSASDAFAGLTYDVQSFAGLVLETSTGFDGEYTVTYRCN